jgi:hypothetical protein
MSNTSKVTEYAARVAAAVLGAAALIAGILSLERGIPARYEFVPLHHTPAVAILALLVGPVLLVIAFAPRRFW